MRIAASVAVLSGLAASSCCWQRPHAYNFIDYCNGNPVGASANAQYSSTGQAKEQI